MISRHLLNTGVPVLRPLAGFRRPMEIIWFGRVSSIGHSGQHKPQIEVVLRPAEDSNARTIRKLVPAAFVRALRLGDVWHGPNLVAVSSAPLVRLKDLQISGNAENVRPIGLPLEKSSGEFPLDFRTYSAHSGHTGAFTVRERLSKDHWMVIPCWEVLRFYFGASGALASRLLSGPIAARNLYKSIRHDQRSDTHWLDLASGLPAAAAATVARIALDPSAGSAARWISNSGTAARANRLAYYPKTNFPFIGSTDLTVQGHWFNQGSQSVLFVERIVSCTHPFPFRQLNYSVLPRAMTVVSRRMQSAFNSNGAQDFRPEVREDLLQSKDSLAIVYLPEATEAAFPDLHEKVIKRVKPRSNCAMNVRAVQEEVPQVLADGSDVTKMGLPQVELASEDEEREDRVIEPEGLDVLYLAADILRKDGFGVRLKSLDASSYYTELSPLARILSNTGELGRAFSCIGVQSDRGRSRTAYCLIRTQDHGLAGDAALLLYLPQTDLDMYEALSQAFGIVVNGQQGGVGIAIAPEAVASNPHSVAKLIRHLGW
jgi:hypothetical protein